MLVLARVLSSQRMSIQPGVDCTVYINAYDQTHNKGVILVDRIGHSASYADHAKIHIDNLYSRPSFEVEVSGMYLNFVFINRRQPFPRLSSLPSAYDLNHREASRFPFSSRNLQWSLFFHCRQY